MRLDTNILFIMLLACYSSGVSQSGAVQLEMMQQKYRAFDYEAVIEMAEQALQDTSALETQERIQIYEMKAASHYSKMEMQEALTSFMNLLRLDSDYELDPIKTSPKIISFYNEIKANFRQEQQAITPPETKIQVVDTVRIVENSAGFYRKTLPASLILPGTGHLLAGNTRKGAWLTSLSAISLGAAVYFTYQTQEKQKLYLNATETEDIQQRYSSYNSAFKKRNALWAAYAIVWAYAQTDLLFFQTPQYSINLSFMPERNSSPAFISCSVHF